MKTYIQFLAAVAVAGCSAADTSSVPENEPASMAAAASLTRLGNPDGRTVVLVPGLGSSAAVWDGAVEALRDDYDLRVVQIAGFAGAPPADREGTFVETTLDAIADHLQSEPGRNTVFVGHSLGGFLSLNLARDYEELVDEVVVVDSLPFIAALFLPGATPEQAAAAAPGFEAQLLSTPEAAFEVQQRATAAQLTLTPGFSDTIADWTIASDRATFASATGELMAADFREELADIEQPVTVLVPWDSSMPFGRSQVEALYAGQYAGLADVQMKTIEGSYHFIMRDRPDDFIAAVTSALED